MRTYTLGGKLKLGDTWAQVSWLLQQRRVGLTEETRAGARPVRAWVAKITELFATRATISFVSGSGGRRPPARKCFLP